MSEKGTYFEVDASILFQLGESLITDEVQALIELIKNAYDADATYVVLDIDTYAPIDDLTGDGITGQGRITIEDNGKGMNEDAIRGGWLKVASSLKRNQKRAGIVTGRGRTPLGDKGLGRLGAQRLGNNIEILTRSAESDRAYRVAFSWQAFRRAETLSQVPVTFEELKPRRVSKGTRLIISDLHDLDVWRGRGMDDLEIKLSQLISPFEAIRDFQIAAQIDGNVLNLTQISEQIRDTSQVRYSLEFDGEVLKIEGRARLDFLRPNSRQANQDYLLFRELVESDRGANLLKSISSKKRARDFRLRIADDPSWYAQFSLERRLDDLDKVQMLDGEDRPSQHGGTVKKELAAANPGPFYGEVDTFDFDPDTNVLDAVSEYKQYIQSLSGIRVYRDGFGIRVGSDWLELGQAWTSGASWYGLKPANTMGYIMLSALNNSKLEETTDREGFKMSPYYMNFYKLMKEFVRFANEVQALLRRGWNEYRRKNNQARAGVGESPASNPEALFQRLSQTLNQGTVYAAQLDNIQGRVENVLKLTSQIDRDTAGRISEQTANISQSVSEVQMFLGEITQQTSIIKILIDQIESLREQLLEAYTMLGLGLAAEVMLHEIKNISDQLASRTNQLSEYLKKQGIRDALLHSYLDYVESTIATLRRQLKYFGPALRYVREKREDIDLIDYCSELEELYRNQFLREHIEFNFQYTNARHFVIKMNKGKLTQVVTNLVLNSEYWLEEDLRLGHISYGVITIELDMPYLRVTDNGRGIAPSVEGSLFDPFVTTKASGRGLGLFIARQLLDTEGCTIALLPVRNEFRRLHVFELNLTKGLKTREK